MKSPLNHYEITMKAPLNHYEINLTITQNPGSSGKTPCSRTMRSSDFGGSQYRVHSWPLGRASARKGAKVAGGGNSP